MSLQAVLIILFLSVTNAASLMAVYFLRKEVQQQIDIKKYTIQQFEKIGLKLGQLAGETKISLSLRYEDLQDTIGKCYANVVMYVQMKEKNKKL